MGPRILVWFWENLQSKKTVRAEPTIFMSLVLSDLRHSGRAFANVLHYYLTMTELERKQFSPKIRKF